VNFFSIAKACTPKRIRNRLKHWLETASYRGSRFQCPVCEAGLNRFNRLPDYFIQNLEKNQYIHSILAEETLNFLEFECPACGAYDRDRLYALYYRDLFKNLDTTRKYVFIDFAPSPFLSPFLRRQNLLKYRTADLIDPKVDDRVDITDMRNYDDHSVDFFLCSHILEHVPNDRKALDELYRILRPGGKGVVMVPILLTLTENYENPKIVTEADRWRHFGQHDHIRIYSKPGFIARLEQAGFHVNQYGIDHFSEAAFSLHGIHYRSVLYVVEKSASTFPQRQDNT
jgi:predicted SAM-dependent methyltransferase